MHKDKIMIYLGLFSILCIGITIFTTMTTFYNLKDSWMIRSNFQNVECQSSISTSGNARFMSAEGCTINGHASLDADGFIYAVDVLVIIKTIEMYQAFEKRAPAEPDDGEVIEEFLEGKRRRRLSSTSYCSGSSSLYTLQWSSKLSEFNDNTQCKNPSCDLCGRVTKLSKNVTLGSFHLHDNEVISLASDDADFDFIEEQARNYSIQGIEPFLLDVLGHSKVLYYGKEYDHPEIGDLRIIYDVKSAQTGSFLSSIDDNNFLASYSDRISLGPYVESGSHNADYFINRKNASDFAEFSNFFYFGMVSSILVYLMACSIYGCQQDHKCCFFIAIIFGILVCGTIILVLDCMVVFVGILPTLLIFVGIVIFIFIIQSRRAEKKPEEKSMLLERLLPADAAPGGIVTLRIFSEAFDDSWIYFLLIWHLLIRLPRKLFMKYVFVNVTFLRSYFD